MSRRIERILMDLKDHLFAAGELSLGVVHAVAVLARERAVIEQAIVRHDEQVLRRLPGF